MKSYVTINDKIKLNVAEMKCTFQEWFAFKHRKVSARICTLLLDNCDFDYSVLFFTAPCGLEVLAGKYVQTNKKEVNIGRPSTTDSQRSTERQKMKHKMLQHNCYKTRGSKTLICLFSAQPRSFLWMYSHTFALLRVKSCIQQFQTVTKVGEDEWKSDHASVFKPELFNQAFPAWSTSVESYCHVCNHCLPFKC